MALLPQDQRHQSMLLVVILCVAAAALYGPLHGGANEAVLRMLTEIGSVSNIPAYVDRVKQGEMRLMGFGHRVYKNFDPRARILKKHVDKVFEISHTNSLSDLFDGCLSDYLQVTFSLGIYCQTGKCSICIT